MHKVILLVLTDEHAAALPHAVQRLRSLKPDSLWFVHSPHIGVVDEKLIADIDKEIVSWRESMDQAAARHDFDAAKGFKEGWEKKRMAREEALRSGWSKVDPAVREKQYAASFGPFVKEYGGPVSVTTLAAVPDPQNPFGLMRELQSAWLKDFVHGSYIITWPTALHGESAVKEVAAVELKPAAIPIATTAVRATTAGKKKRKLSEYNLQMMKAKQLGVFRLGMKKEELLRTVRDAEAKQSQPSAVPAAAAA